MKKFVAGVIIGIIIGGGLLFNLSGREDNPDADNKVIEKLDKILENQNQMFNYLKFIKNRSR